MSGTAVSPYNRHALPPDLDVMIYDSTLRDGEQMPSVSFTIDEKMQIAAKLAEAGVRQIEAGFPAVSVVEREAVKAVASMGLDSETLALSRCCKPDIDAAVDCDVDLVMLFIASSDLHLEHKYRFTRERACQKALEAMEYAGSRGVRFSFSTEDSTRTDLDFLLKLCRMAEESGACRIGLADTTGCIMPSALGSLVGKIVAEVKAPVSVHLHNDFGLGLANALAAVENGATAVATTVNGIGERGGNVALEQLVMALEVLYGLDTGIKTSKLKDLCDLVADVSGIPPSPNAPWSGSNVFRHESGIHVAAMESDPRTYECVPPELVGAEREFVLGKHSGKVSVASKLKELGHEVTEERLERILQAVKDTAQAGEGVDDERFKRILEDVP